MSEPPLPTPQSEDRLDSWKEIAAYLQRDGGLGCVAGIFDQGRIMRTTLRRRALPDKRGRSREEPVISAQCNVHPALCGSGHSAILKWAQDRCSTTG